MQNDGREPIFLQFESWHGCQSERRDISALLFLIYSMRSSKQFDVVILGGGLAGSTLARQLKLSCSRISILVAEKRHHPVPEASFKVGEAVAELGSHYLSKVLGLERHLECEQIPKHGLRFFFSAGDNTDITRRVELGPTVIMPASSYQIDRGRFENTLGRENLKLGVEFLDACRVNRVSLNRSLHSVTLLRGQEEFNVSARWVVDATGRASLLKRQLGYAKSIRHDINAAWFRIGERITVNQWSNDAQWRTRVPAILRESNTVHLMGRGYWAWIIPLASGSTSIGIVADAALHPFSKINRFDRAMEWLRGHEPQCSKVIDEQRAKLQDFHALKHFSYSCQRVFSPDRYALTGEAGVFLDPLYSPGTDFIAFGNGFVADLILRDLNGEEITERTEIYNSVFLATFELFLKYFQDQYPLMGNTQVMAAKVVWDMAGYWGVSAFLYLHNKFCDLNFMLSILSDLNRFYRMNAQVQALFREWDKLDQREWRDIFVNLGPKTFLYKLNRDMVAGFNDDELRSKLSEHIALLEVLAKEIFRKAARGIPMHTESECINPYTMSLPSGGYYAGGFSSGMQPSLEDLEVASDLNKIWFDLVMPPKSLGKSC